MKPQPALLVTNSHAKVTEITHSSFINEQMTPLQAIIYGEDSN